MKVTYSCLTLCDPMDYTVHGILQARILEWVAFPFSRVPSQPRNWTRVSQTRSPTLQADSLAGEPQRKPKNTRVGSLSLLQQIFLTQGLNQGLLHCRQILTNWAIREALLLKNYPPTMGKIHRIIGAGETGNSCVKVLPTLSRVRGEKVVF